MYENLRLSKTLAGIFDVDGMLVSDVMRFLPESPQENVLDYGAGNSPYRGFVRCQRYVTADITQNTAGTITHLIRPGHPLSEPDGSFDLILLMDVLEHLPDPRQVVAELRRLLRPKERLIVSVPFLYQEHETPHDYACYTPFGIKRLFSDECGKILRQTKVGNDWYTLYTLFLERGIGEGERVYYSTMGRVLNKIVRMALPLLTPLITRPVPEHASIYHHLLLEIGFAERSE